MRKRVLFFVSPRLLRSRSEYTVRLAGQRQATHLIEGDKILNLLCLAGFGLRVVPRRVRDDLPPDLDRVVAGGPLQQQQKEAQSNYNHGTEAGREVKAHLPRADGVGIAGLEVLLLDRVGRAAGSCVSARRCVWETAAGDPSLRRWGRGRLPPVQTCIAWSGRTSTRRVRNKLSQSAGDAPAQRDAVTGDHLRDYPRPPWSRWNRRSGSRLHRQRPC